jgi:hypothetical protein
VKQLLKASKDLDTLSHAEFLPGRLRSASPGYRGVDFIVAGAGKFAQRLAACGIDGKNRAKRPDLDIYRHGKQFRSWVGVMSVMSGFEDRAKAEG